MRESVVLNDAARQRLQKLHQSYIEAVGNMAIALGLNGPVSYDPSTGMLTVIDLTDQDAPPLLRRVEGGDDAPGTD